MLLNFLSNSLKFTNKNGRITVNISILSSQIIVEQRVMKKLSQKVFHSYSLQHKSKKNSSKVIVKDDKKI